MEQRLNKFLAEAGVASIRQSEKLIFEGHVTVNNRVVTEPGYKVVPNDTIKVDDEVITKHENKVYYMLYKPTGYVSTMHDDRGRKTVGMLVKDINERVFPVGRLDYDTSGLLLFTNDGDLSNLLTKPDTGIEKEYKVTVRGLLRREESSSIERGVDLGDYKTRPCKIYNVKYNDEKTSTTLDIVIKEGKNREIRNLFDSVNHEVKTLKRTRFGNITLDIRQGEYRQLKPYEVKILKLLALNKIKNTKKN